MSTQREIIYSVKTILRGGLITDDDDISDRQVAFLIDAARARLLRQQYDKRQSISENSIQHIKCMDLEEADTSFDPNFNMDCLVYKTVLPLPKFIEGKNRDLITSIQPTNLGSLPYEFIHYTRLPYARATRFKRPLAVLFNNYMYLIDSPYTEMISVSGVFENPNDLSNYTDCENASCFDWDVQYPVSAHLVDPIVRMVVEELTLTLKVPQDKTNSGNQDLETQQKPE